MKNCFTSFWKELNWQPSESGWKDIADASQMQYFYSNNFELFGVCDLLLRQMSVKRRLPSVHLMKTESAIEAILFYLG